MARYSKTSGGLKLENGDSVSVMGAKGKVQNVIVMGAFSESGSVVPAGVLVEVDMTRGKGESNIFNLSEIEGVFYQNGWVDLKLQPIS